MEGKGLVMDSERKVDPAPAVYAAAVAILAYGLVVSTFDWIGSSPRGDSVALGSGLASVASAAVALAVISKDFRPILAMCCHSGNYHRP